MDTEDQRLVDGELGVHMLEGVEEVLEQLDLVLDILCATRLTNRVHRQLRVAEVERADAELAEHRSDGGATGHVVLDHERLQRHLSALSDASDKESGGAGGGVPLLDVGLDDRPLVDLGSVVLLVEGGVVGVEAVSHVRRQEEGFGDSLLVQVRCSWCRRRRQHRERHETLDQARQHVGLCAVSRDRANFLVVKEGDCTDRRRGVERFRGGKRLDQSLGSAEARHLVVESRRVDELIVDTTDRGRLRVVEAELKVLDLLDGDAKLGGEEIKQDRVVLFGHDGRAHRLRSDLGAFGSLIGALVEVLSSETKDGNGVVLNVELECFVDGAVEVNGEGGNAEDGSLDVDELASEGVVVLGIGHDDTARDTEVAVEPRGPDTTTVGLNAALQVSLLGLAGDGLDLEVGRVRVGADDVYAVAGLVLGTDGKGDDSGLVASEVVLAASLDLVVPKLALLDTLKASSIEQGRGGGYRVEGGGARIDVLEEATGSGNVVLACALVVGRGGGGLGSGRSGTHGGCGARGDTRLTEPKRGSRDKLEEDVCRQLGGHLARIESETVASMRYESDVRL